VVTGAADPATAWAGKGRFELFFVGDLWRAASNGALRYGLGKKVKVMVVQAGQ
jgi:hypothetical protein